MNSTTCTNLDAMSISHISDSLGKAGAAGAAGAAPRAPQAAGEKEVHVVEYVVASLFADKKRQLRLLIDQEYAATPVEKRAKTAACACGCVAGTPCRLLEAKKADAIKVLAHKHWVNLEKSLVRDIAQTLVESKRAHRWCAKNMASLEHENAVLKARLAVVASVF